MVAGAVFGLGSRAQSVCGIMKGFQALIGVCAFLSGCASQPVPRSDASSHPPLTRPLDEFCRSPAQGVFALPTELGWDVVIADARGVWLGWGRNGAAEPTKGPRFRSKSPSLEEMTRLSSGQSETEILEQFGEPSRTWYDLYPVVDSVVPVTRIFGRDTKHCDYRLFTTTPASDVVELTIWFTYTKDQGGLWRLSGVRWRTEGERESNSVRHHSPIKSI